MNEVKITWIPVKERTPDRYTFRKIKSVNGDPLIAVSIRDPMTNELVSTVAYWRDDKWVLPLFNEGTVPEVLAWAPMPDAYGTTRKWFSYIFDYCFDTDEVELISLEEKDAYCELESVIRTKHYKEDDTSRSKLGHYYKIRIELPDKANYREANYALSIEMEKIKKENR